MDNLVTYYGCWSMAVFLPKPITCFWEIMSIEASNRLKPFVYYWPTRFSIPKTFSFYGATTNLQVLIGYTAYDECKRRYSIKLWKVFSDVFNCLPAAALIDEKIICMHGGLSPELKSLHQIAELDRPCDVPDVGLMCDLLWSDPDPVISGWGENDRGVSYVFGADIVTQFLEDQDLDLLVRAHQVVEDGYEFFAGRRLVTLFSAPNYCGEFDNAGGMITVDEDLMCSFQILKPSSRNARFGKNTAAGGAATLASGTNASSG